MMLLFSSFLFQNHETSVKTMIRVAMRATLQLVTNVLSEIGGGNSTETGREGVFKTEEQGKKYEKTPQQISRPPTCLPHITDAA